MRPSPLITLPALPANATSDSHRSLYPYGGLLAVLRLAPPINHPACLRIRPSTNRLLCPFGAAFRPTCSSRRTINLPAQPVDPTSDSSTAVFSGGAFQLTFRLASPINLPACLLFHLRLSSPIACPAPPTKRLSDGGTHRGYPGDASRPTAQEVRRQIPGQDPRRECEGVTRDPRAGETRGAQKSL